MDISSINAIQNYFPNQRDYNPISSNSLEDFYDDNSISKEEFIKKIKIDTTYTKSAILKNRNIYEFLPNELKNNIELGIFYLSYSNNIDDLNYISNEIKYNGEFLSELKTVKEEYYNKIQVYLINNWSRAWFFLDENSLDGNFFPELF